MENAINEPGTEVKAGDAAGQQIVYIRLDCLNAHPDNPRKDLGDLTELAASIKANGIYQNLTVVPYYSKIHNRVINGLYTVIIGHRRASAAKLAGLETVPCVIADMSPDEQLATMLAENMQRNDLTVYEQAKSFQQLTMDFGKTTQEISAMSGFSEATVRRRQRLAELDEKKFKAACHRGATLFDFAELEKVEDPEAKERCLEAIGTQNFKNVLRAALDDQRTKKKMVKWVAQLETFATRIEQQGRYNGETFQMNYVRNYGSWTRDEDVEIPTDAETVKYFFTVSDLQISVYREYKADTNAEAVRKAREEISAKANARWDRAQAITARHKALRRDFVMNFGAAKSHAHSIMRNCVDGMIFEAKRNYYSNLDMEDYCKLLGIPYDSDRKQPDSSALREMKATQPERLLLLTTYWYMDKYGGYARRNYNSDTRRWEVVFNDNQELDALYYFLEELGYERSDEERQMSRGTHEVYGYDEIPAHVQCMLCKSSHPHCTKCCANCEEDCNIRQECRKGE